jgi:hypothetical protein
MKEMGQRVFDGNLETDGVVFVTETDCVLCEVRIEAEETVKPLSHNAA